MVLSNKHYDVTYINRSIPYPILPRRDIGLEKLTVLNSFVKGFKRNDATDVINAFFIAERLANVSSPFTFENRDNNGVDSPEIRRLLIFNRRELEKSEEKLKKFYNLGKRVSRLNSNELKWVAQYIRNRQIHLFPEEAQRAKKLLEELSAALKA